MLQLSPDSLPPDILPRRHPDCGYLSRLLVKSAHGDQSAFTTLYDETSFVVYGLAVTMLGSRAAADELTEAVYVKIWTQSGTYRPDQSGALTWILGLARACVGQQLARCGDTLARPSVG